MKIDIKKISDYEKLIIKKGLCDYEYIMDNLDKNDPNNLDNDDSFYFQIAFYDFYLSARWSVMEKKENWNHFFDVLKENSGEKDIVTIVEKLKNEGNKSNEFSIASKLIHTLDDSLPIYDSKIRKYLVEEEEDVKLWWQRPIRESGANRGTTDVKKIENDWGELIKWYGAFLKTEEADRWIKWFNKEFLEYTYISDIKKIDFIIWAHVSAEERLNKLKEKQNKE